MDECILLFGLNENVAKIGADYAKVAIFEFTLDGVFESYTCLLDMIGYAGPAVAFDIIAGFGDVAITWVLLASVEGMTLFWLGVSWLAVSAFCFILFGAIALCKGWLDPFLDGMFRSFGLKVRV